jgi:hypothetical protein
MGYVPRCHRLPNEPDRPGQCSRIRIVTPRASFLCFRLSLVVHPFEPISSSGQSIQKAWACAQGMLCHIGKRVAEPYDPGSGDSAVSDMR